MVFSLLSVNPSPASSLMGDRLPSQIPGTTDPDATPAVRKQLEYPSKKQKGTVRATHRYIPGHLLSDGEVAIPSCKSG